MAEIENDINLIAENALRYNDENGAVVRSALSAVHALQVALRGGNVRSDIPGERIPLIKAALKQHMHSVPQRQRRLLRACGVQAANAAAAAAASSNNNAAAINNVENTNAQSVPSRVV